MRFFTRKIIIYPLVGSLIFLFSHPLLLVVMAKHGVTSNQPLIDHYFTNKVKLLLVIE